MCRFFVVRVCVSAPRYNCRMEIDEAMPFTTTIPNSGFASELLQHSVVVGIDAAAFVIANFRICIQ